MFKSLFCSAILNIFCIKLTQAFVFFPRGSSCGIITALQIPVNLPNRDTFLSFNFEANFNLPPNDTYYEWIDRWNLDNSYLGIGNNVTLINGRQAVNFNKSNGEVNKQKRAAKNAYRRPHYSRHKFYSAVINYLELFGLNGTACLLRTICEIGAYNLAESNGVLGSILQILFMPTTSTAELELKLANVQLIYEAEHYGVQQLDCLAYNVHCPYGIIDLITTTT